MAWWPRRSCTKCNVCYQANTPHCRWAANEQCRGEWHTNMVTCSTLGRNTKTSTELQYWCVSHRTAVIAETELDMIVRLSPFSSIEQTTPLTSSSHQLQQRPIFSCIRRKEDSTHNTNFVRYYWMWLHLFLQRTRKGHLYADIVWVLRIHNSKQH